MNIAIMNFFFFFFNDEKRVESSNAYVSNSYKDFQKSVKIVSPSVLEYVSRLYNYNNIWAYAAYLISQGLT